MAKNEKKLRQIRKLREAAARLVEKGKHAKALDKYAELEQLDPDDAGWSKRVADCHRRLGKRQDELAALIRAADGYSSTGFVLKAVAMCKLVLAIDPEHTGTIERLASLHATRSTGLDRFQRGGAFQAAPPVSAPASEPPPPEPELERPEPELAPPPAPEPELAPPEPELERPEPEPELAPPEPELPAPSPPLESMDLHEVVDSRLRLEIPEHSSGIYELNLDDVDYADELEAPSEGAPAEEATPSSPERAREAATELFARTPLFSEVSEAGLVRLIGSVSLQEVAAGDRVFRAGDPADALYVVAEGAVDVIQEGPPSTSLAMLGEGEFFGEIALLSNTARHSTVVALEDTQLLVMDRAVVSELCEAEPAFMKVLLRFLRFRLIAPLLDTSPLFAPFSDDERKAMAKKFQFLELEEGAVLIEEGKRASGLFVLLSGEAEVVRGETELLATLQPGDVFGEMSLITGDPAVGSVCTTKKAFALEMPAARFTETVMVNPQVLMYVSELADQRRRQNEADADEQVQFR